ncbi:MAG TPA: metal ABC transporter substrate-binding protein [Thermodesulfobacteriota bacterium]|nr:metal ABC transporter substrate-binding protein [Thermodesulfobacteriota bacterium]
MKKKLILCLLIVSLLLSSLVYGEIKVVAAYPYIGDLVKKIGGDKVEVFVLGKGAEDPHFIVPKPSFIAKLRGADLLIINGAELEIGFIPVLVQQANNPRLRTSKGFLDLSRHIRLLDIPANVSRSEGDIHPEGNPHFLLDPHRLPPLAKVIEEKLCTLDSNNCQLYERNLSEFIKQWNEKTKGWDRRLSSLKGKRVIEYHRLFDYFLAVYDLQAGGTLEPKPGIPPTARHIEDLIERARDQKVDFILQDVYHEKRSAQFIAEKVGASFVLLPHDVGAVPEAKDLFSLFDEIVRRLSR